MGAWSGGWAAKVAKPQWWLGPPSGCRAAADDGSQTKKPFSYTRVLAGLQQHEQSGGAGEIDVQPTSSSSEFCSSSERLS